jgi:hypothetical protein
MLLFTAAMVVLCAGLYPWMAMPGANLAVASFHSWIDVHSMVGLLLFMGMIVHIKRRLRRIFRPARRNSVYQSAAV